MTFYNDFFSAHDITRSEIVYLDFRNAVDEVPHNVQGQRTLINDNVHNWIKNWQRNRKQRIIIHAIGWTPATSGVPQDLFFRPVLFIIYRNNTMSN